MMVAKVATISPVAGTTPAQDETPADAQAFTQLLDEKTAASAAKSPLPSRGLAKVKVPHPADGASSGEADESGSATAENIASESLLVWLNQFRDSLPTEETAGKAPLSPEGDALPGSDLRFSYVAPRAAVTDRAVTPLAVEVTSSDDNGLMVVEGALLPATMESVTGKPAAADAAFTRPAVMADAAFTRPAVTAAARQPATTQQASQTGDAAITRFSVDSTKADQPPAVLQPALSAMPIKNTEPAHSDGPLIAHPELAAPSAVLNPSDNTAGAEPPVATGQLTQQMGTPAWQQSLGQQLACFTRDGIQHAELRLHPEELGSIQITLQLKNEQAQMHFVSASHQVRAAIEAAVPHLRSSLAESGIELGQSSVGADSSSGWKGSGQSEQADRQNFAQPQPGNINQNREERIEKTVRTASYSNGVNTFA